MDKRALYTLFVPLKGRVIGLDALMGVGKSLTGSSMEHFLISIGHRARYFPEFDNPALLNNYLKQKRENAWSFQSIMVMERIRIHQEAHEFAEAGGIAIIDRTMYGDQSFESLGVERGHISPEQHAIYQSLLEVGKQKMVQLGKERGRPPHPFPHLDIILYQHCDYDMCLERLKRRGNEQEIKGYSKEDYVELEKHYLRNLSAVQERTVVVDFTPNLDLVYRDGNYYLPEERIIELLLIVYQTLKSWEAAIITSLGLTHTITTIDTTTHFNRIIGQRL